MRRTLVGFLLVVLCCIGVTVARAQDGDKLPGEKKKDTTKDLKVPEGIVHLRLPRGTVKMENVLREGKPVIRLSVKETVLEASFFFFGNEKGAIQFVAFDDGVYIVPPKGDKVQICDGVWTNQPGSKIGATEFFNLDQLAKGNVFVSSPSIVLELGPKNNK